MASFLFSVYTWAFTGWKLIIRENLVETNDAPLTKAPSISSCVIKSSTESGVTLHSSQARKVYAFELSAYDDHVAYRHYSYWARKGNGLKFQPTMTMWLIGNIINGCWLIITIKTSNGRGWRGRWHSQWIVIFISAARKKQSHDYINAFERKY